MRSCGQQAAAIHRTTFSVPSPIATASHHSSPQAVVHIRAPRSPPTSPRHSLDPADPELVRQLRQYLLRGASRPAGISDELEQMLQCKLAVSTHQLEDLFSSSSLAESSSSSQMQPQQLQELESGLDHMLQLFSKAEVFRLLQQQPALLFVPLASWCEFFTGYGFSSGQIKNLISQTRGEVMTKSDLVTAGEVSKHSINHLTI